MNTHHGRTNAHPGNQGIERPLIIARVVRHIGRGATHIETNHAVESSRFRHAGHPDNTAGRAGQHRILTLESMRVGESAAGLHELQPHARQSRCHAINIATQHRRQISVHHGCIASRHIANQGGHFVRYRHLGETDFTRQQAQAAFMIGVAIAVH